MGSILFPPKVKLFCSVIFAEEQILSLAKKELANIYSQIDFESRILEFNYTDYYTEEMGQSLSRQFLGFSGLILPEELVEIKIKSNQIEEQFINGQNRQINIDPGYIALEKMILATTKNYSHRPYLQKGIYADLTYLYSQNSYQPLPWTYPDYREKENIEMFNNLRKQYWKGISLS